MIIELTGIPGAGKSTVLNSLQNWQETKAFVFDIQGYILNNLMLPLKGKIGYELVLLTHIFLLKQRDWHLFQRVFLLVKGSGNTFFHKINILRNTLKKLIIYNFIKDRDEIFLIDEGVTHIPFTVFVDVNRKINETEFNAFLNLIPSVDALLIIDAPDKVLTQRVLKRGGEGHRRINFSVHSDVIAFMQQSRSVLEKIKKHFKGCVYQNIEKDIDTHKIIEILGLMSR